jgi:hypothetical protein
MSLFGSGRARSLIILWDTKPVRKHMTRARCRSLEPEQLMDLKSHMQGWEKENNA